MQGIQIVVSRIQHNIISIKTLFYKPTYRKDCQIYQFLYLKAQNAEIKGCQLIKKSIAF